MLTRQARGSRAAIGGDLSKSFLTFERKIFAFQGYWIAISRIRVPVHAGS